MIYKALRQPMIFSDIIVDSKTIKRNNLSKNMLESYTVKLNEYMEKEKPYLDPNLTLMDLSEKTGIPYRSLSEVINLSLNKNFYDYINEYRIIESTKILLDKESKFKTILEVLYNVGYNSKSSFNTAFKKHTGLTPTEYKKTYRLEQG